MTEGTIQLIITSVFGLATVLVTLLIKRGQEQQARKVDKLHDDVNGKMQQLIESKEAAASAIGKAEGRAEEKQEQKDNKI